jgi:hypothetical protein
VQGNSEVKALDMPLRRLIDRAGIFDGHVAQTHQMVKDALDCAGVTVILRFSTTRAPTQRDRHEECPLTFEQSRRNGLLLSLTCIGWRDEEPGNHIGVEGYHNSPLRSRFADRLVHLLDRHWSNLVRQEAHAIIDRDRLTLAPQRPRLGGRSACDSSQRPRSNNPIN